MHVSVGTKIRIVFTLAVVVALFATIGWGLVKPWDATVPVTTVWHHNFVRLMFVMFGLTVVVVLVGFIIGGKGKGQYFAAWVVPAGISVWAIFTARMNSLLWRYDVAGSRSAMFYRLAADTAVWFIFVIAGYFASRIFSGATEPEVNLMTHPTVSLLPYKSVVNNILSILFVSVFSLIIIKILARSGEVQIITDKMKQVTLMTVPKQGQIVVAVLAGFFFASWAGKRIFGAPLWCFILSPLLVAVFVYVIAAQQHLWRPGTALIDASLNFAAILPLQYIGLGCLAAAGGYWMGMAQIAANNEPLSANN